MPPLGNEFDTPGIARENRARVRVLGRFVNGTGERVRHSQRQASDLRQQNRCAVLGGQARHLRGKVRESRGSASFSLGIGISSG